MAIELTANVRAGLTWKYTKSEAFGDTEISSGFSFADALASGTGADQADRLFVQNYSIAASGNQDLDLAGVLTDVFGTALTFARVKAVIITFQADNTASEIRVGGGSDGAGLNAFVGWFAAANDMEKVHSSGAFLKYRADATGWPVTAGTADILRISNLDGANAAKISVAVIGASA